MLDKLNLIVSNFAQRVVGDHSLWLESLLLFSLAIIILIFSFIVANKLKHQNFLFHRFSSSELLTDLIQQSLSLFIKIFSIVIALQIIGAGALVGAIVGTVGILGLGISFAFKDIVENYIAGIILSIRQPFLKGDHVLIENQEGIVQRMTSRMTMIKSFEGNNISIPNATIFKSVITNYSRIPERRFDFCIGIASDADPDVARKIGLQAMNKLEGVMSHPLSFASTEEIASSSITVKFFGWVNQQDYDFIQVRSLAISTVKKAIEKSGIEIPDPSYIIKMQKAKSIDSNKEFQPSVQTEENLISPKNKQQEPIQEQIKKEASEKDLLTDLSTE